MLAIGIGGYFALRFEPVLRDYLLVVLLSGGLAGLGRFVFPKLGPIFLAIVLVGAGLVLAGVRAHSVAAPSLDFRYYGAIEGRIIGIDRSASDKVRLTLDAVVLERMAPTRVPERIRISLHGDMHFTPAPGLRVMTTGHLSSLQGPVEPGGFDFRRMGWFQGLGAVGYTRNPTLVSAPAKIGFRDQSIARQRMVISTAVQDALPGRTGAFAAAIMTGDRSAMDIDTIEALRVTNLAHLLAISGLHMGLLTGFVFAAIRLLFALWPWAALRWPTKKLAAIAGLVAGAYYYALSGGNVATERAFIMVSVMFCAVLMDRRAITLRAVAIAATLVLIARPEVLLSPGFQMSFAATTALVAAFGFLREWPGARPPRWASWGIGLVVSSTVAGLATAPVAAAHFNRFADYGLIANLLSVPLMGLVVMPGAVLAAVLAPIGLAWIGLWAMKPGIDWILMIADWVSGFEGASTLVVSPDGSVLPLLSLGALWMVLWKGKTRVLGVFPLAFGFLMWSNTERPDILISEGGGLIGVLTSDGRVLSKEKGDGFSAKVWLENDGDGVDQYTASMRTGIVAEDGQIRVNFNNFAVSRLFGRAVENRIADACANSDMVIVSKKLEGVWPCDVHDLVKFRDTGSIGISFNDDVMHLKTANDVAGARLWVP